MMLSEVKVGERARVSAVSGDGRIAKRLMEMGIVPGVDVRVIRSAPFGDPIEIRLLGYNLALRLNEAESIEVESLNGGIA